MFVLKLSGIQKYCFFSKPFYFLLQLQKKTMQIKSLKIEVKMSTNYFYGELLSSIKTFSARVKTIVL